VIAHYLHFLETQALHVSQAVKTNCTDVKKTKKLSKARRVPHEPKDRHTRVQNNTVKECEKNDRKNSHSLFNKEWNK
jgi:hypothetical protein